MKIKRAMMAALLVVAWAATAHGFVSGPLDDYAYRLRLQHLTVTGTTTFSGFSDGILLIESGVLSTTTITSPISEGTAVGDLAVWDGDSWEPVSSLSGLSIGGLSTTVGTAVVSDSSGKLSQSFANLLPDAADGAALGSADMEWSDVYLADGAVVYFGADQDVSLTHVPDSGLTLNGAMKFYLGDAGTYVNQPADGVLQVASDTEVRIAAGSEDLKITSAANEMVVGTNTGATKITSALDLMTTGALSGKIPSISKSDDYTLGTDSAQESYGYIVWMSGASKTLTLPAVVAGMSVCLYSTDANAKSVDPNASDGIRMDAARDTDGHKITSGGAIGDRVCLVADSADGWTVFSKSGTWTAE